MKLYEQLMSVPNILTLFRMALVPLTVICYYWPTPWSHILAVSMFALAAITDWLDGYLARYLHQTTMLGAFLDPVADKLMVSVVLVLIVAEPTFRVLSWGGSPVVLPPYLLAIPAVIIVGREIIVSALREWMAELGARSSVAVSGLGKVKTFTQMVALIVLLYCDRGTYLLVVLLGIVMLYIAAFLTIWSMFVYLRAAWIELSRPT